MSKQKTGMLLPAKNNRSNKKQRKIEMPINVIVR